MFIHSSPPGVPDCRKAVVPACEADASSAQDAQIEALGCFQLRLRDALDYQVDFSQWLQANGNAQLTAAQFAVASGSPGTPTIVGQAFNPGGKCMVVISAPEGAKAGDAYWLDVTATVGATAAVGPTDVAVPARTLVRRIHVVVANG